MFYFVLDVEDETRFEKVLETIKSIGMATRYSGKESKTFEFRDTIVNLNVKIDDSDESPRNSMFFSSSFDFDYEKYKEGDYIPKTYLTKIINEEKKNIDESIKIWKNDFKKFLK